MPGCVYNSSNTRYVGGVKISVIVPAFNEEKLLGASLEVSNPPPAPLPRVAGDSS